MPIQKVQIGYSFLLIQDNWPCSTTEQSGIEHADEVLPLLIYFHDTEVVGLMFTGCS